MNSKKTLCELKGTDFFKSNFKEYKKLVRNAEYVCKNCGRVAALKKNLCEPKRLYPKTTPTIQK